jgi:hypothetical protein
VWNPITEPVDYVLLADQRSPGLAELQKASSPRRWDERRGYGLSGARVVYRGIALSHFTLLLRLYTVEDWDAWHEWKALVQRAPDQTRPRALDFSHPITDELGIRSVVVENVLQPVQTADGEWTIEIGLIEYRTPTPALLRPDGSVTRAAGNGTPEQTIEFLDVQIQRERALG